MGDGSRDRAEILYVKVPCEESERRNKRRARPGEEDSILYHSLPDEKMRHYYDVDDWEAVTGGEDAGRIELRGRGELSVREKADETGTLYGSVSAATSAKLLSDGGHGIGEKDVRLEEPIKKLGTHEVAVHVHGEHFAGIQVTVTPE